MGRECSGGASLYVLGRGWEDDSEEVKAVKDVAFFALAVAPGGKKGFGLDLALVS